MTRNGTGFKTRGVLYMVWGDSEQVSKVLDRSIASLKQWHPAMPVEVIRRANGSLLDKSEMFALTPFEETLFLDADTVVLGNLDYGFMQADRYGLACCICECPWARRYGGLKSAGDMVEYNTGVLFFTERAKPVFDAWRRGIGIDSSIDFFHEGKLLTMPENDQAAFAKAIDDTGFNPFVLPMNWNFRPIWQKHIFGPVKIWHDYTEPPVSVVGWTNQHLREGAIIDYARLE